MTAVLGERPRTFAAELRYLGGLLVCVTTMGIAFIVVDIAGSHEASLTNFLAFCVTWCALGIAWWVVSTWRRDRRARREGRDDAFEPRPSARYLPRIVGCGALVTYGLAVSRDLLDVARTHGASDVAALLARLFVFVVFAVVVVRDARRPPATHAR